jgi:predicted nucleotide-binding protein
LHNWGIAILLQQQTNRIEDGFYRILLAYIEDLIDFRTINEVYSAPAHTVLSSNPFLTAAFLDMVRAVVEEQVHANRIPKDPETIVTEQMHNIFHVSIQQFIVNRRRIIFVVHGRNIEALNSLRSFLQSIGLTPITLTDALPHIHRGTPYVGEVLDSAFSLAHAVIVLMTPDDKGLLKRRFRRHNDQSWEKRLTGQARLNVIYEAGLAMGGVFRNQTVLIELGDLRPFSDIGGRFMMRLNNEIPSRQNFIAILQAIGCAVNLANNDWQTIGDFENIIRDPGTFDRFRNWLKSQKAK